MENNEMLGIKEQWRTYYGEKKPIAFYLRESGTDFWLRTHSLPESKRYAQNEDEMGEILRRYNQIGDSVLGVEGECILFFDASASKTFRTSLKKFDVTFNTSAYNFGNLTFNEDEDSLLTICGGRTRWKSGNFNSILCRVANDRIHHVSFFNNLTGEIFAPYDGGADLFLSSETRRDELKTKFADWLSKHPQGL